MSSIKKVFCGVKRSQRPYSQLDENGILVGLEEDVVDGAFSRIDGYEVEFVCYDDQHKLFEGMDAGEVTLASGQFVKSPERKAKYQFPDQWYQVSPIYLISRTEDKFETLFDIAGQMMEFSPTSFEKTVFLRFNREHPDSAINVLERPVYLKQEEKYALLSNGERNVLYGYKSSAETIIARQGFTNLYISKEPVIVEAIYQVFANDADRELIEKFSAALRSMLEDGTLGAITKKWCGTDYIKEFSKSITPME